MLNAVGLLSSGRVRRYSSRSPPGRVLREVIRHHPHRGDAEVDEDLCATPYSRESTGRPSSRFGVDGVSALLLQGVRADLVSESDAESDAALVTSQVHDDAGASARPSRAPFPTEVRSHSASNRTRRRSGTRSEPARARRASSRCHRRPTPCAVRRRGRSRIRRPGTDHARWAVTPRRCA